MRRVLKTFFSPKIAIVLIFHDYSFTFFIVFLTVLTVIITLILLMEERTVKRREEEPSFFEVSQNRFL